MAPPKLFSGARAIVRVKASPTSPATVVGVFSSFSYGMAFSAQPAFTLGAYSAREIDYTAQELVQISASGWRVVGAGPNKQALVPYVGDLLNHEYIEFVVEDRQTRRTIAHIRQVRPTGVNTPIAARSLVEQSYSFVGILVGAVTGTRQRGDVGLPEPGLRA
jgi:hypothetical protein